MLPSNQKHQCFEVPLSTWPSEKTRFFKYSVKRETWCVKAKNPINISFASASFLKNLFFYWGWRWSGVSYDLCTNKKNNDYNDYTIGRINHFKVHSIISSFFVKKEIKCYYDVTSIVISICYVEFHVISVKWVSSCYNESSNIIILSKIMKEKE